MSFRDPGASARRAVCCASAAALVLAAACARQEAPRGGEPDRTPPVVLAVQPAALSTAEDLRRPIRIEFSERISERLTGGTLDDAVMVSPSAPDVRVRHRGTALEVDIPGGLRPGVVYRVSVQPVIRDLFGNSMREPFEFVFSTGGELNPSAVVGLVLDRVTGLRVRDVTVQAVAEPPEEPPVVHVARTDTGGVFVLRYLPAGSYTLLGFLDRNRNREADPFEVQGGQARAVGPADTVFADFTIQEPDTTAARLVRTDVSEPALVRLTFDDFLDPAVSLALVGATIERADGEPGAPEVVQLLHEDRWVALRRAAAAAPDSAPPPDSAAAPAPRPAARGPINYVGRAQGADSTTLGVLGLALPSRVFYAELSDTLHFSVDYVVRTQGVENLAGLQAGVDSLRVSRGAAPEAPPPPGRR